MSPATTLEAPLGGLPTAALRGLCGDITDSAMKDGAAWLKDPRQPKPAVLAFDPGAMTGWARLSRYTGGYNGGTLVRASGSAGSPKAFLEAVDDLLGTFAGLPLEREVFGAVFGRSIGKTVGEPALLVVIEDTFLFRPKDAEGRDKSNPKTLAAMARNVGAIIALATLRGLPVWRVMPNFWQSRMLGKIRRAQGKQLSLARARAHFGARIETDHQADAALMALCCRGGRP